MFVLTFYIVLRYAKIWHTYIEFYTLHFVYRIFGIY